MDAAPSLIQTLKQQPGGGHSCPIPGVALQQPLRCPEHCLQPKQPPDNAPARTAHEPICPTAEVHAAVGLKSTTGSRDKSGSVSVPGRAHLRL